MYKLSAHLASAIVFIDRPMPESLLYYALACEHFGGPPPQKLHLRKEELLPVDDIPLVRDPAGWFRCSWMMWDETRHAEFTASWKKRWASQCDHLADFGKSKAKVDTQRGSYKSYDVPLAAHAIEQVWFFLETDNPVRLLELLNKWVPAIGKKIGSGYGRVVEWELEKLQQADTSLLTQRPIPANLLPASGNLAERRLGFAGWLPPYWLPDHQQLCSIPL